MTDNLKKFFAYLSEQDDEAKDKICKMEKEELIAFAANQGFTLTNEDFENPEGEVSLDEAEAIAGGGECNCIIGGGGTGSTSSTGEDIPCACNPRQRITPVLIRRFRPVGISILPLLGI